MSIYLGTSEPTEIYIGTTPVNEVYVGSTKVRPTTPPTPSTYLFYFPFTSNQTDQMGNTYISTQGTRWNTWYIFDSWVDTIYLWAWGTQEDQTNILSTKTISVWVKWISSNDVISQSPDLGYGWVCYNFTHVDQYYQQAFQCEDQYWNNGWASTVVQWTWYYFCIVDTWGHVKCYLNWEERADFPVNFWLNWNGYYLLRNAKAEISEFIWDSASWTEQDVSDYWTRTRTNYWYL